MKKVLTLTVVLLSLTLQNAIACGGGLMAYTPSAGNETTSGKKADFFLISKGVSSTMFDVKALQPVFREVTATGNERNEKNLSDRAKKRLEKRRKDEVAKACTTGTHTVHDVQDKEDVAPVLNLHKLH